jgi:hypothetical protein
VSREPDIFDDLGQLRIDPRDPSLAPKTDGQRRPKARHKGRFIMVPRIWEYQLRSAKNLTTYRLALLLLFEHWRNGRHPVRVTNALAAEFGIPSRRTKRLALIELERLRLIAVEREGNQAPLVRPRLTTG